MVFPKGEEVLKYLAPEKTFWDFDTGSNYLLIKAKGSEKLGHPGQRTDISVATASGNVYTFLIQETSNSTQSFDLRLELEQEDGDALAAIQHPQFVRADLLAEVQQQRDAARQQVEQTKRNGADSELHKIRHDYHWKQDHEAEQLGLRAIYHDDVFTYIELHSQEAPALYEQRDGRDDSLVQYTLQNGLYVVPRVLDDGYFRIGKKRVEFTRVKESI